MSKNFISKSWLSTVNSQPSMKQPYSAIPIVTKDDLEITDCKLCSRAERHTNY